jgi:hypothetical protein
MVVFSAAERVVTAISEAGSPPIGSMRPVDPAGDHPTIAGGLFASTGSPCTRTLRTSGVCADSPDRGAVIRVPSADARIARPGPGSVPPGSPGPAGVVVSYERYLEKSFGRSSAAAACS